MEPASPGALVTVAGAGPALDGIVFDTPSGAKVVVAVVDPARGPMFRTVSVDALSERAEDGEHDHALRLLIRRTPPPVRGAARGGGAGSRGRSAGYKRGTAHRPTGR
ncbi:MAG TPA: hypothetical protein VG294_02360 [Solirubrobacteraceae bacterium]|jgi:hypothetical protein|nr:hypothetical protein [Solirubrobacteraceae bacterium]